MAESANPKLNMAAVKDLIPYARNTRTHSDEQVNQIVSSIKEFGFTNPVLVDEQNMIIAGHGRVMAANKLKLKKIPTISLNYLTEAQKKAYIIADNRLALNAGWDEDMLKVELEELNDLEFDISLLGFEDKEIEEMLSAPVDGLTDEDAVPELPEEPTTKLGDLWLLGEHRLLCGDSTSIDAVDKLMGGQLADMVFTDPPYNVNYSARTAIRSKKVRDNLGYIKNDNLDDDSFKGLLNDSLGNAFLTLNDGGSFYVCNNWHCALYFMDAIQALQQQIKAWIVWNKDWMSVGHSEYRSNHEFIFFGSKGGKAKTFNNQGTENDVWTLRKLSPDKKIHTTEKPVALVERAIINSSGLHDLILDLFIGSGTTLIAAEKTNRKCYGMELDPKYCDVIIQRWEEFTGNKAELSDG